MSIFQTSQMTQMTHYHKKEKLPQTLRAARPNFLSEWVRFGAKSKLTRMGVYLAYIPIRGNELGAEDDPLSQEIILAYADGSEVLRHT